MVFPRVFLFCTKQSHVLYGGKRKFRPYIGTKLQCLHGLYGGIFFSNMFCAILTKIKGVSIYISIPHCPMDYCIPAYSTVFFLLNKALLVIVWNNLNGNSVEY